MKIKSLTPDSFWLIPLVARGFSFDLSFRLGGAVPAKKPLTSVYNPLWSAEGSRKQALPAQRASRRTPLVVRPLPGGPAATTGSQASILMGMGTVSQTQTTPWSVF